MAAALAASLRRLGVDGRLAQARATTVWTEVVGAELARHARAVEVRDGILRVAVRSSAWSTQLSFFRSDLLRRLNDRLGPPGLRGLQFQIGPTRDVQHEETAGQRRAAGPTAAQLAQVEAAAAAVEDPQVRRAWRRALLAAVARRCRLGA
jgi:hypothetical protein